MIIQKHRPDRGICFAWLPKWTDEGLVWLEWLHFEHSNDGLDIHPWRYRRWVSQDRYDAGERAQCETETDAQGRRYFGYQPRNGYATPPDISKCGKLQPDGPTPCHYPHCTCMNFGGSKCPT